MEWSHGQSRCSWRSNSAGRAGSFCGQCAWRKQDHYYDALTFCIEHSMGGWTALINDGQRYRTGNAIIQASPSQTITSN